MNGPSIMPGGSEEAYKIVEPIFTKIAAQVDGTPCCTYIGDGGAGHYVKMVHNGIEYADMQLIAEAYDLLKERRRPDQRRAARSLYQVERGRLGLVPDRDHRPDIRQEGRSAATTIWWTASWTKPPRRAPANGPPRTRSIWASP